MPKHAASISSTDWVLGVHTHFQVGTGSKWYPTGHGSQQEELVAECLPSLCFQLYNLLLGDLTELFPLSTIHIGPGFRTFKETSTVFYF